MTSLIRPAPARRNTCSMAVLAAAMALLSACSGADSGVPGEPGAVNMRRLSETQYRHTIADVFGPAIPVTGRFEPDMRDHGLLAIGSAKLSITPSGFEQYYAMAAGVAGAVMQQDRAARAPAAEQPQDPASPAAAAPPAEPPPVRFVTCEPANPKAPDEACARETLARTGRLLFRRPLTEAELAPRLAIAASVAEAEGDFHAGIEQGLVSLLVAPEFLFRVELAEPVSDKPASGKPGSGKVRLNAYNKAERLSFLLWDAAPDAELLRAAESGELHTRKGVEAQLDRMLASPRLEDGARAFFDDMLQNDLFATLTKDASIYPKFSLALAASSREQTLRTLVDHLVVRKADYRDIFTTRDTFIDRTLASLYRTPFLGNDEWAPYTFPEGSEHAGVLTHVSFLSLFSHPGRSSPTKRGVAVNEVFLCEETPLPPANVDFSIVNDVNNPQFPTVRQRLLAHSLDPSCSNCHDRSDPVGLALERFDALGQVRMNENGQPIDVTATLAGKPFEGSRGLAQVLRDDARAPACLVEKVYSYALGRAPSQEELPYLEKQTERFARGGYRFPDLLQRIARSEEFFSFTPAATGAAAETRVAAASGANGGSK